VGKDEEIRYAQGRAGIIRIRVARGSLSHIPVLRDIRASCAARNQTTDTRIFSPMLVGFRVYNQGRFVVPKLSKKDCENRLVLPRFNGQWVKS